MDFFSKLGKKASKTYQATKEKAVNLSEELKIKGKISEIKDKINDIYTEIGKTVYNEIKEAYSISAGLDYPGVGPEHAYLHEKGRVKYDAISDKEAIDAFRLLTRLEGIIPAIESSHAVAYSLKIAKGYDKGEVIIICLSGRGDKDIDIITNLSN